MHTLTQEQIVKVTGILTELDEHPLPVQNDDRRHANRLAIRTPLQVMLLTGASDRIPTPVDIFSRNISPAGLGFVCRRMFRPDERVAIALHIHNVPPRLLLARITFGRYIHGGLYEMGAEFLACIADPSRAARIPLPWLLASGNTKTILPLPPTRAPQQPAPQQPAAPAKS